MMPPGGMRKPCEPRAIVRSSFFKFLAAGNASPAARATLVAASGSSLPVGCGKPVGRGEHPGRVFGALQAMPLPNRPRGGMYAEAAGSSRVIAEEWVCAGTSGGGGGRGMTTRVATSSLRSQRSHRIHASRGASRQIHRPGCRERQRALLRLFPVCGPASLLGSRDLRARLGGQLPPAAPPWRSRASTGRGRA